MADWSRWSSCSTSCKGGYQTRERHIQIHPELGGRSCETTLKETQPCNEAVQCFAGRVDCEWDQWTAWSECNNLDFQLRTRGMKTPASGGGVACSGDVRELRPCKLPSKALGTCAEEDYSCDWGGWTEWSECSATCGTGGVRTRTRSMQVGDAAASAAGAQQKFGLPALEGRLQRLEQRRLPDTAAAFGLGFCSISLLLLLARGAVALTGGLRRRLVAGAPHYDVVPQH